MGDAEPEAYGDENCENWKPGSTSTKGEQFFGFEEYGGDAGKGCDEGGHERRARVDEYGHNAK
jgi:hypothetical protein